MSALRICGICGDGFTIQEQLDHHERHVHGKNIIHGSMRMMKAKQYNQADEELLD